jgi:ribosomal protein L37AE/L43A
MDDLRKLWMGHGDLETKSFYLEQCPACDVYFVHRGKEDIPHCEECIAKATELNEEEEGGSE